VVSWIRNLCWRLALALVTWKILQKCGRLKITRARLHRFGCGFLSLQVPGLSGIRSLENEEKCWTDGHYPQQGGNKRRQEQLKGERTRLLWNCQSGAGRWQSLGER
jgi:hypothetical protein